MKLTEIHVRIEDALNDLLAAMMAELDITTGDISPEQSSEWENIVERTARIFAAILEQNGQEEQDK